MVMKPIEAFVFLPRRFTPHTKVEITDSAGTAIDITKKVMKGEFTKVIFREGIGDFKLKVSNVAGSYTGKWIGGNTMDFYADLVDGTTKKFTGRVDYIKEIKTEKERFLEIGGRHTAYPATEKWVFKSYSAEANDIIIKGIADTFLSGFTYNNVDSFSNTLTKDWEGKKNVIDCYREVCIEGDADGYIDDDRDIHLFAENSVLNKDEAAVERHNLISLSFGKDTYYEKNKITVYGKDDEGMDIIYTAGTGDRILPPIVDFSIKTMQHVKEVADAALAQATDVPDEGTILTRGLPTLEPGENMWISAPRHKIHGIYKIIEVKHLIGRENKTRWSTQCKIERPIRDIGYQLSQGTRERFDIAKTDNPHNLEFTDNFTFDDDSKIASHSTTQTTSGYLATDGSATGTAILSTKVAERNVSKLQLKYKGENNEGTTFSVSVNAGVENTYVAMTKDELLDPFPHTGRNITVKVEFGSASAKVYSLSVGYK